MKFTENKSTISMINKLAEIVALRKSLEIEEKSLKNELRAIMKELGTNVLACEQYIVMVTIRIRSELDKEKVLMLLGAQKYAQAQMKSEYQIIEIKKA